MSLMQTPPPVESVRSPTLTCGARTCEDDTLELGGGGKGGFGVSWRRTHVHHDTQRRATEEGERAALSSPRRTRTASSVEGYKKNRARCGTLGVYHPWRRHHGGLAADMYLSALQLDARMDIHMSAGGGICGAHNDIVLTVCICM